MAYQIISYDVNASANQGLHESSGEAIFTSIWSAFINSVLIPLVVSQSFLYSIIIAHPTSAWGLDPFPAIRLSIP